MNEETPTPNNNHVLEEEFVEFGDYDLEDPDVTAQIVLAKDALPYPDTDNQDNGEDVDNGKARSFVAGATGVRTPEQAIDVARSWSQRGVYFGSGQCLRVIRQTFNIGPKYGTAAQSWWAANHKHRVNGGLAVPRGVPVYWTGGSSGAGHIALSVGGGVCLSTDWKRAGKLDYAHINDITNQWGLRFEGFANEINDVEVWKPAITLGTVSLKNLHFLKKNQDVHEVKQRLWKKGYRGFNVKSYRFGLGLRHAYAKYQRHLGYTGSGANGIPGTTSLKKLGFNVVP